jgi:hypothetical protein
MGALAATDRPQPATSELDDLARLALNTPAASEPLKTKGSSLPGGHDELHRGTPEPEEGDRDAARARRRCRSLAPGAGAGRVQTGGAHGRDPSQGAEPAGGPHLRRTAVERGCAPGARGRLGGVHCQALRGPRLLLCPACLVYAPSLSDFREPEEPIADRLRLVRGPREPAHRARGGRMAWAAIPSPAKSDAAKPGFPSGWGRRGDRSGSPRPSASTGPTFAKPTGSRQKQADSTAESRRLSKLVEDTDTDLASAARSPRR